MGQSERDRRQTSTLCCCCWLENVLREIAERGRSDNRQRDTGKACWIVGRKVEKLSRRQHCVVGRHNWKGHTGTLGNRPLKKQGLRKDAADAEKLNGTGGGGPP